MISTEYWIWKMAFFFLHQLLQDMLAFSIIFYIICIKMYEEIIFYVNKYSYETLEYARGTDIKL